MRKAYVRDGRGPLPLRESTSRVMSANKARNTHPELSLRRSLWKAGIRGYRLHWGKAQGRPDIAFPGRKIAIFVNGCFWHRCPYCQLSAPKSHTDFWKRKFDDNAKRDQLKARQLRETGWNVMTLWECELNKDLEKAAMRVKELLSHQVVPKR